MTHTVLPALPTDWEPTRATLHAYARAVGVIPRAHAAAHPKWWHISLKVRPVGLVTDSMPLPGGGSFHLRLDLRTHDVVVDTSSGEAARISMQKGLNGTEFGDAVITAVAALGVEGDYLREKFESDEPRVYDPAHARAFFDALIAVDLVLEEHRSSLAGEVGPLQIWPHGFDLAFEWFGSKTEEYDGEELQAQLNLGWYPAGDAYFYSNPWPFAEGLTRHELPEACSWHTDGWEGSILRYAEVAGDPDGAQRVLEYARAVFDLAAPTLTV